MSQKVGLYTKFAANLIPNLLLVHYVVVLPYGITFLFARIFSE
jgi:hypothetical protein